MNPTTLSVWRFIAAYIDRNHIPPTVREIAAGCTIASTSVVVYHLNKLRAEGLLESGPARSSRNIRLNARPPTAQRP